MADSPTSPNQSSPDGNANKPAPKKELSMEMRLLLAFLLMGLVLFLTPYLYKAPAGPKRTAPAPTPQQAAQVTQKPPEAQTKAPAPPQEMPGQIAAGKEQEFVLDTDLYRIRFSNRGAVIRSWELKKFKDHTGKELQLVNTESLAKIPAPFSVSLKDDKTAALLNYSMFVETRTDDGLGVDYEFSDGKTLCRKSFRFARNSYLSQFSSEVAQNGTPVPHSVEWRGGFGDPTVPNRASAQHSVHYDVAESKLITKDAKAAKDGAVTARGNYSFAGLDDTFFAFVVLPKDNTSTEVVTVKDEVPAPGGKDEPHVGVAIGGDSQNKFAVFVGPKDIDILRRVDPKLQQLIDWGWFWFIAQPLFAVLHYINDHIMHNYGWSIVLITIIINLLLLPLRFQSLKSARKMQALQPQIAAINARYKNLSLRDPKKAEQNAEVMDLYKKHGANPLGGCLPMVIQIPILYAFYKVLTVTIEMRNAPWLWVADLSQPEQLPLHILPIIMIVTQFIMQKMTPNPSMDPAQAKMMQFMPLMFGFFFYNMSSGLVLYWLTGNVVGILQQYLINKYTPAPVVAIPKPALTKTSKR
jgi:YidC/Oxa1 family membrane protein insertase